MFPMLDRSIKHNYSMRWDYSEFFKEYGKIVTGIDNNIFITHISDVFAGERWISL
jgi:hypothetical protein